MTADSLQSEVEVIQADREAAAAWFEQAVRDGVIRRGHPRDYPLARAFAKHRLTHTKDNAAGLREALIVRDAAVAVCPYMKPHPPASDKLCSLCGADAREPCRKRVIADAEFVTDARAALAPLVRQEEDRG